MRQRTAWHVDFYLETDEVIHDNNRYETIIDAVKAVAIGLPYAVRKGPIKSISIKTWKDVWKESKNKLKEYQ